MSDSTVPSVKRLSPIVQGEKLRGDRRWWYRAFRWLSVRITWVLLHTQVTPNQVTVASLLVALVGLVLVAMTPWIALAGYLMLLFYHLMDRVDGEIARFRRMFSLHGIYLDNAGHYLTSAGVFLATTFRVAGEASRPQVIWLIGSAGALAAVLYRAEKQAPFHLFSQYVVAQPELLEGLDARRSQLTREAVRADRAEGSSPFRHPIGAIRDLVLTLTSFPAIVTMLFAATVAEIFARDLAPAVWVLVALSLLQLGAYISLEAVNLSANLAAETRRLSEVWADLSEDVPVDDA